jgi:hypothetical protein
MQKLLFHGGDLAATLDGHVEKMRAVVYDEAEETFLQADASSWAKALARHFAVACPEINTEGAWREESQSIKVDVSRDQSRYFSDYASSLATAYPGYRVTVHIPFTGEAAIFGLRPNTFTYNPPRGLVRGGDLLLVIDYPQDKEPEIDDRLREFTGTVNLWLGYARSQMESFNARLEQEAFGAIAARRERIARRDAGLAKSALPVGPPGDASKTKFTDVIVRRPAPTLPATRADGKAPVLEPALVQEVYEHVLALIRLHGRQVERDPGAYAPLDEEARRTLIVNMLNTHYAGRASAEAFNHRGKTDILLREGDKNLFIGECKFWGGAKGFTDTIDQVFRYTAWRDTKLALVIFVDRQDLTAVLGTARDTLAQHPQFVRAAAATDETELRAVMHWPGDQARNSDLGVIFIHTPKP